LDDGLGEFVLAKGTCCSQGKSPPQLATAAALERLAVNERRSISNCSRIEGGLDPAAPDEDAQIIQ
jgi:hypothetical protein